MLKNEIFIRLICFFGILFLIMLGEKAFPRRELSFHRLRRWPHNLGIVAINSLLLRIIFAGGAIGMAILSKEQNWGIFNNIHINYWLAVVISFIVFDFVIYMQHLMFHAVPLFWRFHRMHHTDLDFDTTTGLRFHPIEIILSMLIKMATVVLLGAPVLAVLIFEIALNATSMFNHGNIKIPIKFDKYLRLLLVTPDMHRVHHSVFVQETNSNFGFNLPWWDRLLGTYKAQPIKGHTDMTIGINTFHDARFLTLQWLLILPFLRKIDYYPIGYIGRNKNGKKS